MPGTLTPTSGRPTRTTTLTADREPTASGIAIIDKPQGLTSHQVVARVRRLAGTRKVGHAGTLDPMATGVLVVGVERATRLLGHLSLTDKAYLATIRLGVATGTDDAEGEPVSVADASHVTAAAVEEQLGAFRGEIDQVPSSVSAIKVDGVRSYARVRSGEDVALAPRRVTVSRFALLRTRVEDVDGVGVLDLDVAVECSSGTYVRALARDLGTGLGVGGHLTALRRSRVGPFSLDQAQTLDEATDGLRITDMTSVARRCFATLTLDPELSERVGHGRRLAQTPLPSPVTALLSSTGALLALYRPDGDDAVPVAVFPG